LTSDLLVRLGEAAQFTEMFSGMVKVHDLNRALEAVFYHERLLQNPSGVVAREQSLC
jgi:hypothetical protein